MSRISTCSIPETPYSTRSWGISAAMNSTDWLKSQRRKWAFPILPLSGRRMTPRLSSLVEAPGDAPRMGRHIIRLRGEPGSRSLLRHEPFRAWRRGLLELFADPAGHRNRRAGIAVGIHHTPAHRAGGL